MCIGYLNNYSGEVLKNMIVLLSLNVIQLHDARTVAFFLTIKKWGVLSCMQTIVSSLLVLLTMLQTPWFCFNHSIASCF